MIIKTTIISDAGVILSETIKMVETAPVPKTRQSRTATVNGGSIVASNGTGTTSTGAVASVNLTANGKRMGRPPKAAAAPATVAPAPAKRAKKAAAPKD